MNLITRIILPKTRSKFSYSGKTVCQCGSLFCEILSNIRDGLWYVGKICFYTLFMLTLAIADPEDGMSKSDIIVSDIQVFGWCLFPICAVLIWGMKIIKRAAADGDVRLPYECIIGYIMGTVIYYFWGAEAIAQVSFDGTLLLLRLYLYPYVGMTGIKIAAEIWHDLLNKQY